MSELEKSVKSCSNELASKKDAEKWSLVSLSCVLDSQSVCIICISVSLSVYYDFVLSEFRTYQSNDPAESSPSPRLASSTIQ